MNARTTQPSGLQPLEQPSTPHDSCPRIRGTRLTVVSALLFAPASGCQRQPTTTPRPGAVTISAAEDVVLVGSSMGGWLGAEIALRDTAHRVTGLVIIDGRGVDVPGHPITNLTGFTPAEIAKVSFHDPASFAKAAPPPTPERIAMMRANQATLAVFAGDPYGHDPTLLARLSGVHIPTLLIWGASDHVVTTDYGRAYAAAIPKARFEIVEQAGHLAWLEQPADTFRLLDGFVTE